MRRIWSCGGIETNRASWVLNFVILKIKMKMKIRMKMLLRTEMSIMG